MSTSRVGWMVWCAAVTLLAGWEHAAGGPWRAAEQPGLKQALEQAPLLRTESLGETARGVNTWEHWLVPNPDGKTWDALQLYFKEYYGPTWLFAVDLGTGQVKKQRLPDHRQFYLSGRALGLDGKYYIVTPGPSGRGSAWGMFMHVYDPATNTLQERGEIVPDLSGEVRPIVVGPDGRLYGTGSYEKGKVGLYIYDPKLGKVAKNFGPVGPSHPNGAWSRYVMGVDDTHAYIASGMIPSWYLVAVNLQTGEEKVLLESPTQRVMDIIESFPGAWAIVPQGGGAPQKEYWLYHGEAIAKLNDTPPWPMRTSPWDKAAPKPEMYWDQIDPDAEGHATLWYRLPEDRAKAPKNPAPDAQAEDLGWKSVRLNGVESYALPNSPLALLPDGRLYGTGGYAGSFIFDPRTDQTTHLGRNHGLAAYTNTVHGDRLYSSGYPGGPVYVFDAQRPWTPYKGGPPNQPPPDRQHRLSNPRELGSLSRDTRVAIAHCCAVGADGKIYFGGFGERSYTGGGLGWYDPQTEKIGGFWKPLSGYWVNWLAPMQAGRLIVMSTSTASDELNKNRAPDEAKLFVYDVTEGRIVREIVPVPKAPGTGLILDVAPDRLLGLTVDPEHPDGSLLYGVDVASGEVLFRKALPWPVSSERARWYGCWVDPPYEYYDFVRGPDGFAWTWLKNVLVRIDPKDATVHVVGKIEPCGMPTFVGRDMYLSGTEQLRRIRSVVPAYALAGPQAGHGATVLDDALEGSTIGTRSGGRFVASDTGLVRLKGNSFCDDAGPFLGLGASYFQALRHAKYDRRRLSSNLALLASKGFNYVRILSMVSWDGLEIAPVSFTNRTGRVVPAWPDYWRQFRDLLDLAAQHGLRVEVTIFADAQYVMPAQATRQAHLDGVLANIAGREHQILYLEVANEGWQNGFPGPQGVADLRRFAQHLADRTSVPVAITSNDDTSNQGIAALYRGSAADLATVHFSRDTSTAEGGWLPVRDPYRAGRLPGVPPVNSNEPIGPGSSVSSESDPIKLCSAAVFAYVANLPAYVYHSRAGVSGYGRCCPPAGGEERFENTAGINAYQFIRQILPPDLASWVRNDGLEPGAPLTVFCNNQPNRYWPEATRPTDGCDRNIGSAKGSQFVCFPMGILAGGVTLQARRPVRFQVFNPLTGAVLSNQTLGVGDRFTLPQGPGAHICKGNFLDVDPPPGPNGQ